MPIKRYDKKVKAAIIAATTAARSEGKSWNDAFKAAKDAGYTGSRGGLEQMIRNAALKSKKQAVKKPGRPAGKRRGRPPMQAPAGLDAVQQIVERTVRQQVNAAIDRAVAALEQSKV
ncbi:MAG TPA: hypothetical protein VGP72_18700 [Planctomycetota bacterium]|jgi:hypothetical protein